MLPHDSRYWSVNTNKVHYLITAGNITSRIRFSAPVDLHPRTQSTIAYLQHLPVGAIVSNLARSRLSRKYNMHLRVVFFLFITLIQVLA